MRAVFGGENGGGCATLRRLYGKGTVTLRVGAVPRRSVGGSY